MMFKLNALAFLFVTAFVAFPIKMKSPPCVIWAVSSLAALAVLHGVELYGIYEDSALKALFMPAKALLGVGLLVSFAALAKLASYLPEKWEWYCFYKRLIACNSAHKAVAMDGLLTADLDFRKFPQPHAIEHDIGETFLARVPWFDEKTHNSYGTAAHKIKSVTYNTITPVGSDKPLITMKTCGLLSMSHDPEILELAQKALKEIGGGIHGSHGSPLFYRHPLLIRYEEILAEYMGKEACMVCQSGFHAGQAIIAGLLNKESHFVADDEVHLCIRQGASLSRCKKHIFHHNNFDQAERIMKKIKKEDPNARIVLVTESIYSMSGSVCDHDRACELREKYGAILCVDDSHGIGVFGTTGRSLEEFFNKPNTIDVTFGSLGKCTSGSGGYVAGRAALIDTLCFSSSSGFSSSLPPFECAHGVAIFQKLMCPAHIERIAHVKKIATRLRLKLREAGFKMNVEKNEGGCMLMGVPIIGCYTTLDVSEITLDMAERGYAVFIVLGLAVAAPICRTVAQAWMTEEDVDKYVAEFSDCVGSKLGGINGIRRVATFYPGEPEMGKTVCVKIGSDKFAIRPITSKGHAHMLDFMVDKELKSGVAVATGVGGLDISQDFVTKHFLRHDLDRCPSMTKIVESSKAWKLCDGKFVRKTIEQKMAALIPSNFVPPGEKKVCVVGNKVGMKEGLKKEGYSVGEPWATANVIAGDVADVLSAIDKDERVRDKYLLLNKATAAEAKTLFEAGADGIITSMVTVDGELVDPISLHTCAVTAKGKGLSNEELTSFIEDNKFGPTVVKK